MRWPPRYRHRPGPLRDPSLLAAGDGRHLERAGEVRALARSRDCRLRGACGRGRNARRGGTTHSRERDLRPRQGRGIPGYHPPRHDRIPAVGGGLTWPGVALCALRPYDQRCLGHSHRPPVARRERPSRHGRRAPDTSARAARARPPRDALRGPHARSPRRADHLRPEGGSLGGRDAAQSDTPRGRAGGDRRRRDQRDRRHPCFNRPFHRGSGLSSPRPPGSSPPRRRSFSATGMPSS